MNRFRSLAGGLLGLFAIFSITPIAQGAAPASALIGEPIPHTLDLNDQTGAARSFASLKGGKGAILLFTRSLDW